MLDYTIVHANIDGFFPRDKKSRNNDNSLRKHTPNNLNTLLEIAVKVYHHTFSSDVVIPWRNNPVLDFQDNNEGIELNHVLENIMGKESEEI
jgi:hypothetical protein